MAQIAHYQQLALIVRRIHFSDFHYILHILQYSINIFIKNFAIQNQCVYLHRTSLKLNSMAESAKRLRFTKVASTRVSKVINYLNLLQNCSNRSNYEYDADDVDQMFSEITKALKDAKNVYLNELSKQNKTGFTFNK